MTNTKEKVDRIILIKKLNQKQEIVDELYKKEGLTYQVLDMQLEINKLRNKENIPDPTKTIYKNFVQ